MKRGPKPLDGESKHFLLRVRLSRGEYARAMARAAELGIGVSTLARSLMLAECPELTGAKLKKFSELAAGQQPAKDKRRQQPAK